MKSEKKTEAAVRGAQMLTVDTRMLACSSVVANMLGIPQLAALGSIVELAWWAARNEPTGVRPLHLEGTFGLPSARVAEALLATGVLEEAGGVWRTKWFVGLSTPTTQTRNRHPPVIYFVGEGDDGPIKIGITTRLGHRVTGLQTSHPRPLTLLASCPGNRVAEAQLHERFKGDRLLGEWFRRSPEIVALIATVVASGELP
jgi:hypothetical protein